ncbi:MAG: hypothetical protein HYX43_14470 [Burkholderiales bacterium]|nr:hypothetical protein [Burkholderiales bacterium]
MMMLLMLALPFQSSWAAGASYCLHEQRSSSAHLGHHAHQHAETSVSSSAEPTPDAGGPLTAGHLDCGTCHLGCGQALASNERDFAIDASSFLVGMSQRFKAKDVLSTIDRPNWATTA